MMFPNSNKPIIKKLIRRSLKANRTRNRYVILAILMTTWLLTSVFSIGMSYMKTLDMQQLKMIGTKADAALIHPSHEQIEQMKKSPNVNKVGLNGEAGKVIPAGELDDTDIRMQWFDHTDWETMRAPLLGNKVNAYPEKFNEIIVPTWILDKLGITEPKIGMTLPLSYHTLGDAEGSQEHKKSFVLSGWYDDYSQLNAGNKGMIIVSNEFAESSGMDINKSDAASLQFKSGTNVKKELEKLQQELKLSAEQELINYTEINNENSSKTATAAGIAGIVLFVMLSGYLLIYNVLYISVSTDTKFYGLLKTIGMTPKQVKKMVNGQAVRLAWIGIPLGLAMSLITSFVAVPMALSAFTIDTEIEISFHPVIYLGAALFAWMTTMAGCRKPARIAGKISPIEAQKYVRTRAKKGKHGSKLHRMAIRNIFRDKKRAVTVFLSLFLGLTIFLTINTLVLSMNTDNFIASYLENDFEVVNQTASAGYQAETKQKLTEAFVEAVQHTEGVTDVRKTYVESIKIKYSPQVFGKYVDQFTEMFSSERLTDEQIIAGDIFWSLLIGIDDKYITELNKDLETPIDVKRFKKGEIALLGARGEALTLGDDFSIELPSGEGANLEIGGFVGPQFESPYGGMAPNVYVSQSVIEKLIKDPIMYKMNIMADKEQQPAVQDQLKELIGGDREIELTSKLQWAEKMESAKITFYILGGAVTLILAFIGILNFISTMVTSVVVRKHELAVMESIGMTKRQLRKMLLLEGIGYAVISISLIASLGTAISYGAFYLFSQEADYAIYAFPTIPLLTAFVLVFGVCLSVPIIAYNRTRKLSIVERLREGE